MWSVWTLKGYGMPMTTERPDTSNQAVAGGADHKSDMCGFWAGVKTKTAFKRVSLYQRMEYSLQSVL